MQIINFSLCGILKSINIYTKIDENGAVTVINNGLDHTLSIVYLKHTAVSLTALARLVMCTYG